MSIKRNLPLGSSSATLGKIIHRRLERNWGNFSVVGFTGDMRIKTGSFHLLGNVTLHANFNIQGKTDLKRMILQTVVLMTCVMIT